MNKNILSHIQKKSNSKISGKVLGTVGITCWLIGASLMDSEPMTIPAIMAVAGIILFVIAYRISR